MAYEKVIYALDGDVARIALNDPATRNALSRTMAEELTDAVQRAGKEARAVLLSGEGKAFSSGANLTDAQRLLDDPLRDAGLSLEQYLHPMITAVRALEQPVVSAVRGAAAGIGCSLALCADLIVCGESAYFLQAFRHVGLVSDGGSSWLLTKAVGRVRAMEMMLLGERIAAQKALDWGLVNAVVPDEELDAAALDLARRLAAGPRSIALIKEIAWAAPDITLESAMAMERARQRTASRSDDFAEGLKAFTEKRPPEFRGR